jgi:hypothetical protein
MPQPAGARLQTSLHAGLRSRGEPYGVQEPIAPGRLLEVRRKALLGRINGPPKH